MRRDAAGGRRSAVHHRCAARTGPGLRPLCDENPRAARQRLLDPIHLPLERRHLRGDRLDGHPRVGAARLSQGDRRRLHRRLNNQGIADYGPPKPQIAVRGILDPLLTTRREERPHAAHPGLLGSARERDPHRQPLLPGTHPQLQKVRVCRAPLPSTEAPRAAETRFPVRATQPTERSACSISFRATWPSTVASVVRSGQPPRALNCRDH